VSLSSKSSVPYNALSLTFFSVTFNVFLIPLAAAFTFKSMITNLAYLKPFYGFHDTRGHTWIYLRFYRVSELSSATATGGEGLKMKGDASDTFAFVAFFPDRVHPYLAPFCDNVYATLVQLKVCTPFSEEAIEAGNENAASRSEGGLPSLMNGRGGSGRRAEAERRRALALKALDQRLNAAAAGRGAGASSSAQAGGNEESAETAAGADEAATIPAPQEDV